MCKFKVGDVFEIISDAHEDLGAMVGDVVTLLEINEDNCHAFKHEKISYPIYYFLSSLECIVHKYKSSNRQKLQQAIKATGFHAEKLSLATGFKKGYFSDYTSESRFNSRGDITEDRLNSLLTTLAFAERKFLGVGAKTVDSDKTYKPSQVEITIGDVEIKGALVEYYDNELDANLKAIDDSKIKDQNKLYSEYFDSANKRIQQKKDSKVRNFLIVFLIFIVILSIYFFTR